MDESTWRDDLTDDQQRLLKWAESETSGWHEDGIDCYRWMEFVVHLATRLDDIAFVRRAEVPNV